MCNASVYLLYGSTVLLNAASYGFLFLVHYTIVLCTVYCLLLTMVGWDNQHSLLIGNWQEPQALLCLHVLLDCNAVFLTSLPLSLCSWNSNLSPIWVFFEHFDPMYHPNKKHFRICMVCHRKKKDKQLVIGEKCCLTNLEVHLITHPQEWTQYLSERASCKPSAIEKDKNAFGLTQSSLKNHFTTPSRSL